MDAFVERVFAHLQDDEDLLNAALVCKLWHQILKDDVTWRKMYYVRYAGTHEPTGPRSWKRQFLNRLQQRKTFGEWKHLLTFKLGANMGKVLAMKRKREGEMTLVTDMGVIRGRLEKGLYTRTMHYFDTTSGPVGVITCACYLGERLLVSGPSGVGLLYKENVEEYADERMYEVVYRGLNGVVEVKAGEGNGMTVVSRVGDVLTVHHVDVRHKMTTPLLTASDVAAYALCGDSVGYANQRGEVYLCKVGANHEQVAALGVKTMKLECRGKQHVLVYSEDKCFVVNTETKKVQVCGWRKELLGIAFDEGGSGFAVQTKEAAHISPIYNGEYGLLVRDNRMHVMDCTTGEVLNRRILSGPGEVTVLEESESVLGLLHGRNLIFWGNDPTVFPSTPSHYSTNNGNDKKRAKGKKKVAVREELHEEIEEMEEEERADGRMEHLRDRMNIDGLTEEEMVQYALLLSLDS